MICDSLISSPFRVNGYKHREKDFSAAELRRIKTNVFVLTDISDFSDAMLLAQCDGLLNSLDNLSDEEVEDSAFYLFFGADEDCIDPITRIIRCGGIFVPPMDFSKTIYSGVSRKVVNSILESNRILGTLFGGYDLHENLCQAVDMTQNVPGDFLEIGVFTGSSAITACTHMRNRGIQRRCWLMDTFEGFNYLESNVSADCIWGGTHKVSENTKLERIHGLLKDVGQEITLVPGNICRDPLPAGIGKLALVNIDVDMYEAIEAGLQKVAPLVQKRGVIICEDAASTPSLYGAYVAMNEFLNSDLGKKFAKVFLRTQYFLIKVDE